MRTCPYVGWASSHSVIFAAFLEEATAFPFVDFALTVFSTKNVWVKAFLEISMWLTWISWRAECCCRWSARKGKLASWSDAMFTSQRAGKCGRKEGSSDSGKARGPFNSRCVSWGLRFSKGTKPAASKRSLTGGGSIWKTPMPKNPGT